MTVEINGKKSFGRFSTEKAAVLGTSHITWKVLQYENCNLKRRSTRGKEPVIRDDDLCLQL